jgi:uncharacterized membrane protein YcaP (DUF421 family)
MPEPADLLWQALRALGYYAGVLVLVRIAGKRQAGQVTPFDLIVLIGLVVAAQTLAIAEGAVNTLVFIATVLVVHRVLAFACARSRTLRHLLRGRPRALVRNGTPDLAALRDEGVSMEELVAGLRKLGYERPEDVKLAVLEETGHISAVPRE